eukprot:GHRQ01016369.1.p1 GENE.GHRQ01016369.1~~GHRQ01016369.1.p1  ORF type:complete len:175 (-),score=38.78 GHRQ01016369.1:179-703(-)
MVVHACRFSGLRPVAGFGFGAPAAAVAAGGSAAGLAAAGGGAADPLDLSAQLDGDFAQCLRHLSKRDTTTKMKALQVRHSPAAVTFACCASPPTKFPQLLPAAAFFNTTCPALVTPAHSSASLPSTFHLCPWLLSNTYLSSEPARAYTSKGSRRPSAAAAALGLPVQETAAGPL